MLFIFCGIYILSATAYSSDYLGHLNLNSLIGFSSYKHIMFLITKHFKSDAYIRKPRYFTYDFNSEYKIFLNSFYQLLLTDNVWLLTLAAH